MRAHRTEKVYVVKPPAGRFHESLWEIAENHLGDGRRCREVFELNKDRPQPGGSVLTIASLIRPGRVLRMPHDAYGPGIEEVRASPPARHSGRPRQRPPSARRSPAKHAAPPPARMLDTGLRYLGHALRQQGRTPPTVLAAHVGEDDVDLWVNPPDHDVPGPGYAVVDGHVGRLPPAHVPQPGAEPAEVTMLGPACVRAPGDIEPGMVPLASEIVVYLAAHPGGAYPNALARAIWPEGVADEVRDGVLAAVARWLGSDGIGRPHLAADASGRLRLGSGVKVDWHVFLTLAAQAAGVAAGKNGHTREEAKLAQALTLVTGQFLAGIGPAAYAWIVTDGLEYEVPARVADAAHRLWELRLAAGDPRGAWDAAHTGMRIAPDDELLWRDLLTAAHATGQENLLYAAAGDVRARASRDDAPEMAPETEALLDEVLPTWRWTLA